MPVISQSKRVIYLHIPKTAGTAVTMHFYQRGWIELEDWERWYRNNDHKKAEFIRQQIDEQKIYGDLRWDDFFKFTIVRNPFDWMVSFWYYKQRSVGQKLHEQSLAMSFPEFVKYVHGNENNEYHILDQASWIVDDNEEILVDRIIKLESLQEEWASLCKEIGIPHDSLKEINRTHGPFYDHDRFYDEESRRLVEQKFARDFRLFEYDYMPVQNKESGSQAGEAVVQFCPTLGSYCGISTYTEMLSESQGFGSSGELDEISLDSVKVLHLQHEFSIVPDKTFNKIVDTCKGAGVRLFVTMHRVEKSSWTTFLTMLFNAVKGKVARWSITRKAPVPASGTKDPLTVRKKPIPQPGLLGKVKRLLDDFLSRRRHQKRVFETSESVIVHSLEAKRELQRQGAQNVQVMAHPLKLFPTSPDLHSQKDGLLHVGYFGFFSAEKDLINIIKACEKVSNLKLHLLACIPQHHGGISHYTDPIVKWIRQYEWIDLNLQFLPLEEVVYRLSQNDVNVYLTNTAPHGYSTSGSIRQYLAAKRPIIANRSVMTSDLEDIVTILPNKQLSTIAHAIQNYDPDVSRIVDYCSKYSWEQAPNVYGAVA